VISRLCIVILIAISLGVTLRLSANARDQGQWENSDPRIKQWFETLMQPDNPGVRCCGEADGYYADKIEVVGDKVFAIITDTRPDEPLKRPHVPPGTRIEVPAHKYKFDKGNPVGHTVIFLSPNRDVYCYVQASGT
jgi:hypothetical protein